MAPEKTPGTKKVAKRTSAAAPATSLTERLRQWAVLRLQSDNLGKQIDTLKKGMSAEVEQRGYTDDKGHVWLDLDDTVDVPGWGVCGRLQRQKRVSQSPDDDKIEEIATKKGLWVDVEEGGVLTTIVVLDEDALRKQYFEGKFSKAEWDRMFPQKVTYAFVPELQK